MLSCRSVMALLTVLALSAKVARSAVAAPDICTAADVAQGGFCLTCKEKAKCVTADSPPESRGDCTVPGETCTVLAGVATCKPVAETDCSCDKAAQCDEYDPDSVLVCLNGGLIISQNCTEDGGATCVEGACVVATSTESTLSPDDVCEADDNGFVVIPPMCSSASYCSKGDSLGVTNCESGEYFDMDEMSCLPAPPVPCAGCGTGACPDKSDCSKWLICEGGAVLDEETCEGTTPDFDIISNECVGSGAGTCTGNDNCTYGLTTVAETSPTTVVSSSDGGSTDASGATDDSTSGGTGSTGDSTAATSRPAECSADNVGERYPHEESCKKYWSCRKVGTNTYAYVEGTCLGSLVFNPDTGYCDTPENVPDCVV